MWNMMGTRSATRQPHATNPRRRLGGQPTPSPHAGLRPREAPPRDHAGEPSARTSTNGTRPPWAPPGHVVGTGTHGHLTGPRGRRTSRPLAPHHGGASGPETATPSGSAGRRAPANHGTAAPGRRRRCPAARQGTTQVRAHTPGHPTRPQAAEPARPLAPHHGAASGHVTGARRGRGLGAGRAAGPRRQFRAVTGREPLTPRDRRAGGPAGKASATGRGSPCGGRGRWRP